MAPVKTQMAANKAAMFANRRAIETNQQHIASLNKKIGVQQEIISGAKEDKFQLSAYRAQQQSDKQVSRSQDKVKHRAATNGKRRRLRESRQKTRKTRQPNRVQDALNNGNEHFKGQAKIRAEARNKAVTDTVEQYSSQQQTHAAS